MKKGFTLIELLVVIAIIGILAAILFPVFAGARDKARCSAFAMRYPSGHIAGDSFGTRTKNARQSSCLSNVKQLGLAALSYAQDYDEFLPLDGNDLVKYTNAGFDCSNSESYPSYSLCGNRLGHSLEQFKAATKPIVVESTGNEVALTRHNDGSNVCFLDGHAKWLNASREWACPILVDVNNSTLEPSFRYESQPPPIEMFRVVELIPIQEDW